MGLNVNAEARGNLRAEVLNAETSQPLSGFSVGECVMLNGDHIDGQLRWGERARPETGIPVRVRFHLRDASLYAFWTAS